MGLTGHSHNQWSLRDVDVLEILCPSWEAPFGRTGVRKESSVNEAGTLVRWRQRGDGKGRRKENEGGRDLCACVEFGIAWKVEPHREIRIIPRGHLVSSR